MSKLHQSSQHQNGIYNLIKTFDYYQREQDKECPVRKLIYQKIENGQFCKLSNSRLIDNLVNTGKIKEEIIPFNESIQYGKHRAWIMKIPSRTGFNVADTKDGKKELQAEEIEYELVVGVNTEDRTIDTEFFMLNTRIGDKCNSFDDREKFHIIWKIGKSLGELSIWYLGYGSNEPYDRSHPLYKRSEGIGRTRFYVFDKNRSVHYTYESIESCSTPFDFKWSHVPIKNEKNGDRTLSVVHLIDHDIFLSDPVIIHAARKYTRDYLIQRLINIGDTQESAAKLIQETARQCKYRVKRVSLPIASIESANPLTVITLAQKHYQSYFMAHCSMLSAPRPIEDIINSVKTLPNAASYASILSKNISSHIKMRVNKDCPLGDISEKFLKELDSSTLKKLAPYINTLRKEVESDLYHYGWDPLMRVSYFNAGVIRPIINGVYEQIVKHAERMFWNISRD